MDRDEFMELVYETFADEPDNVLANGIIEAADAYAEHEKAQLSQESTTSDLIDRQAAIDAAESAYVRNMFPTPLIREVPPVEPEPTDEQVAEYCKRRCLHIVTDDFFRAIQPEPHEGEWINTNPEYKNGFYNNSYYCSECHDYYTTSPHEMKFCPNCGARMKGVKHEAD